MGFLTKDVQDYYQFFLNYIPAQSDSLHKHQKYLDDQLQNATEIYGSLSRDGPSHGGARRAHVNLQIELK